MISPCRTPVCLKTHHSSSNRPRPHHAAPAHSWLFIPSHPTASTEEAEGNHVGNRGIKTPSNIFDVCCMCERGWENKLPFFQMRESDSSVSQWRRQWEVKGHINQENSVISGSQPSRPLRCAQLFRSSARVGCTVTQASRMFTQHATAWQQEKTSSAADTKHPSCASVQSSVRQTFVQRCWHVFNRAVLKVRGRGCGGYVAIVGAGHVQCTRPEIN